MISEWLRKYRIKKWTDRIIMAMKMEEIYKLKMEEQTATIIFCNNERKKLLEKDIRE